jgi:Cytochrome P450
MYLSRRKATLKLIHLVPSIGGKTYPSVFALQDQDSHRKLKSGIAQKYSLSSLLGLEPLVDQVTRTFMSKLRQISDGMNDNHPDGPVLDLGVWLQYYAFDVIGSITFSGTFGFIDAGSDTRGIVEGLEFGLKYGAIIGQTPRAHNFLLGNPLVQAILGKVPALAAGDPIRIVYKVSEDPVIALVCLWRGEDHSNHSDCR